VVGPLMHRESDGRPATKDRPAEPARHDNWLFPFFAEGSASDGSGYLHVPPLLTYTAHTSHDGLNIVGPLFCKWKGGPACDNRTADKIDLGVAPLYFYGRDDRSEYEIVPPLLHYYSYSDVGDASFNLWGPLLWEHSRESDVFNVMPIYWHNWGKNEDHTTVFPLFHYGYKGAAKLLATPLFVWANGDKGEETFATYVYARYRGRTERFSGCTAIRTSASIRSSSSPSSSAAPRPATTTSRSSPSTVTSSSRRSARPPG
jgi:hypothetical protein